MAISGFEKLTLKGQGTRVPKRSSLTCEAWMVYKAFVRPREPRNCSVSLCKE